jgi:hypothetical protein
MPSCIAVSMALMLPIGKFDRSICWVFSFAFVATPPNAIILANSNVKIADLIKAGILLKLIGIIVIFVESILLLSFIFGIDEATSMFNSTVLVNTTMNS